MSQVLITVGMIACLILNLKEVDSGVNTADLAEQFYKTGRIKGPAGYLYYDDAGQGGVPVVFIHSFGGSTQHWTAQLTELRKNRRAIAIDLRGHGLSDAPKDEDYAVTSLAADIAAVVDSLKLTTFVLVGHSMGGSAAISYAGLHPKRVAGLILSGTPGKSTEAQSKPIIASLESESYDTVMNDYMNRLLKNATPAVDSMERAGMGKLSKSTNIRIIKDIFQYDPIPALNAYSGPKLIIATTQEKAPNSLHAQMPKIPYKTIDGTSHWSHMDKPTEFNKIMNDFLVTVEKKK